MLLLVAALLAPNAQPLDIQADRMELRQKEGVVRFEGSVVVTQGELTLRCARLRARYRKEQVASLVAEGGVELQGEGLRATARTARYDRDAGTLELTGEPTLVRGLDRLSGERILYYPDEARVVVERARGRLHDVPRLAEQAPP